MSAHEFRLPDVGEGLADAAISRWLVPEGGVVQRMQPIVEVETAKSVVELPSPVEGVLVRHGAAEGATLDIGEVLATFETEVSAVPAAAAGAGLAASPVSGAAVARRRVPAAPTVRRRAAQFGVDLAEVAATGPGGRVLAADLAAHVVGTAAGSGTGVMGSETAPPAATVAPLPLRGSRVEALSRMRRAIGTTLADAWNRVPLITDLRDAEATGLVAARAALSDGDSRLGYTALFGAIVCHALARHPVLNASIDLDAGTVTYHGDVHLGIAVSVPEGLAVAVVRHADRLGVRELDEEITRLATAAREGRLTSAETTGATFTVSSFGQFGGWYGTPLVVPPQVAIAGFGPVKDAVIPVDGAPAVRPVLAMSVSADHRLIDGADLSRFCSDVERLVAAPIRLLG